MRTTITCPVWCWRETASVLVGLWLGGRDRRCRWLRGTWWRHCTCPKRRERKYALHCGPQQRLFHEHRSHNGVEFVRILRRQPRDATFVDLNPEAALVRARKGWLERDHFVKQATETPNVALFVIPLLVHLLLHPCPRTQHPWRNRAPSVLFVQLGD